MAIDISKVQEFIANAFTGTAIRNMGPRGTLERVREYLKAIDLGAIGGATASSYPGLLDDHTEKLRRSLPKGGQHWGLARKSVNLFLRDALYNFYLRTHYGLEKVEPWLEIPVDSYVARRLAKKPEGADLPKWRSVKGLKQEENAQFQTVAAEVAERKHTARVHLDLLFWRADEKQKSDC